MAMTSGRAANSASTWSAGGQVSQPWLVNSSSTFFGGPNEGLMPGASCVNALEAGTRSATVSAMMGASRMRVKYT